jgi:hypothetical protein
MIRIINIRKSSVSICVHLWKRSLTLSASATLRFALLVLLAGCSIPNLESASCIESRNSLREFYSYHFGNSMTFSIDDLKAREKFLTPKFAERLRGTKEGTDPFTTGTTDIPKTFRAAECREVAPERTSFDVMLYWKNDERTEERKINVEMVKHGDAWLVDNVAAK